MTRGKKRIEDASRVRLGALVFAGAVLAGTLLGFLAAGTARAADPVKIGVLADESGFSSDIGGKGAVLAAHMAADEFGNTVLGRPIEIIDADMLNKPDVASEIVRRWYDSEGVDVVVDVPVSSVALAVQYLARERKKALLISEATTTALTGEQCSPTTIHWADDTYALSVGMPKALVAAGAKTWFFLSADFAFGQAMEQAARESIEASGGSVVGSVKHPMNTSDFSSFILKAQASGANAIGLANVGIDTTTAIKQAAEFGVTAGGQKIVGFITFLTDIDALTLQVAQGLVVTANFYWDQSDATRAFAQQFLAKHGKMPTKAQANTYEAVRHWLKAVAATGTTDAEKVIPKMKATPIDQFGVAGSIREDGRVLYPITVWEVKKPAESKGRWDYYKPLKTIPAAEAFLPLQPEKCAFLKH